MAFVLLMVPSPRRTMPKPRPVMVPVLPVRLRAAAATPVLPAPVADIVPALSRVSKPASMAVAVPRAGHTTARTRLRLADHRKRSERQRQPEDAQAMTCKWPLRQTVRDFPLHHIPQSHSQCQPGAIAVAIRASTDLP